MEHDSHFKANTKTDIQVLKAPFGKKTVFDFEVSLVEETIPKDGNLLNHWIGNDNSGIDVVAILKLN